MGLQIDPSPVDGQLIATSDDWVAIKTGRCEFFVCAKELMEHVPDVGATIRVIPYARRKFDGTRLDAPKSETYEGVTRTIVHIGARVSRLPVDKQSLKSSYLKDLIDQIEELPAPDGVRTIVQMLIDANAGSEAVLFDDPLDEDSANTPPTLTFRVSSEKVDGYLRISYSRVLDLYRLDLTDVAKATLLMEVDNVDFTALGTEIAALVDDNRWRSAKVVVLKSAPRRRAELT